MNQEINNYIGKRYESWLDYSNYHCAKAGMEDESIDVLNEVILCLLQKSETKLQGLLDAKKTQNGKEFTELDFYVLRSLKSNIYSDTAPYRFKNKPIPKANKNLNRLNIADVVEDETDHSGYVLDRMHEIRELIESMGFSDKAMAIFEYRFFEDGSVNDCPNLGRPKEIYRTYGRIMKLLKKKIKGELLI